MNTSNFSERIFQIAQKTPLLFVVTRKYVLKKRALILSALLVLGQIASPLSIIVAYAAPTISNNVGSSAALDPVANKASRLQTQGATGVDSSTGALTYSYPLALPPGRNNMAPTLALSYNSQTTDSGWVGYGWLLSVPYIERVNKSGSEKLYTDSTFISSLQGELTSIDGINFEQKFDDGSYSKYSFTQSSWQMTDRDGTTYYFGNNPSARIQSDDGGKIGRWYLTSVRDKFGNGITYNYTKDSGSVYPSSISYTEHALARPVNLVTFNLEDKADKVVSYKYNFKTTDTKRISFIKVITNGKDSIYFSFTYTNGSNGIRSLLASIEEKRLGTNGDWTTLPKTIFDYEKSATVFSGTIQTSVNPYGGAIVLDTNADGIQDLYATGTEYFAIDINGDFKKDLLQSDVLYGSTAAGATVNFAYNNGSSTGFDIRKLVKSSTPYNTSFLAGLPAPPIRTMVDPATTWVTQASMFDVNGDGFEDIMYNDPNGGNGVGLNTTKNTFNYAQANNFTVNLNNDQLVDINNDGLLDKISKTYTATSTLFTTYLNNGNGYNASSTYVYDAKIASSTYDIGVRFVDINNDGLVDVLRSYISNYNAIPPCDGFWAPPATRPINQTISEVYINNGVSFVQASSTLSGYLVSYSGCPGNGVSNLQTLTTKEYDTNGDLTTDYTGATNNTLKQDVLKKVNTSLGSTMDVSYTWSTKTGLNPTLAVPMYIVATTTDRQTLLDSNPHSVGYMFYDGAMYFDDKKPTDHRFAGFGKTEVVDGKTKTVTYYHQGNNDNYSTGEKGDGRSVIGRPYRVDTFDISGGSPLLVNKNLSLYKTYDNASSTFTYLDSQVSNSYNSDATWVSSATKQLYDESKRLIKTSTDYGDIEPFTSFASSTLADKGVDVLTTQYQYSNARPQRLVREITTDYSGATVVNKTYYYDGLPFGLADKGALTILSSIIYNSNGTFNASTTDQTTYDSTGNIIQSQDSLGRITKINYDSGYFLPITKVDANNGTTTFTYDPSTLNLISSKGPDGITKNQEVDGFGNTTRSYTTISTGGILNDTKNSYVYGGGITVYMEKKGDMGAVSRGVKSYDSYGRLIQTKVETRPDQFSTEDTKYDGQSNIIETSLPYLSSGYGLTSPASINGNIAYSYDALGRVLTKSIANNTTTYSYGARSLTAMDNASAQHKKNYNYDARGNLSQVNEYNGGKVYTTTYSYTPTNKLSRITDANSNIRNFSYLSNGLISYQEDPHPSTDTTFTNYSYTYNLLGKITKKTGPLGSISYTYDSIDRPLTRFVQDINNPNSTTTLAYTGCSNTYTSPCTISRGTSSTTYAYTSDGKLQSEMLSIDGRTFTRSYTYDSLSNPTIITYPDGGRAVYTYNLDAKQSSLSYITPGTTTKTIIQDSSFNSLGALSSLTFGNGVKLCNIYTATSTDGAILPRLGKSVYNFNSIGCNASPSNVVDLYKDEFTYKDMFTPSSVLSTYKDIAGTNHTKSDAFTYDNLLRLTQVGTSYDGGATTTDALVYDPIGNIISENDVLYKYSQDGQQNAHAVTSIGGIHMNYDAQGNRTQVGDDTYFYNALSQLLRATSSTNGAETYTYDESGERIKKVVQATTLINQKVTPATATSTLIYYKSGDFFSVSTSTGTTTVVSTSTYNKLSTLSLQSSSTVYSLVNGYYVSPFTAQFCATATTTSARLTCVASTTEQLVANDLSIRSATTTMTKGFINDMMQIARGVYQIPVTYTGLPNATTTIASSATSSYSISTSTVSSYNTYVATGIVTPVNEFTNLPMVSTSTYQTLVTLNLADTGKLKTLFTYAGCTATSTPCTAPMQVVFERSYKNSGLLVSNKDLNEMWYVYASKARVPSNLNEYATEILQYYSISC